MKKIVIALLLALAPIPAFGQASLDVKDAGSVTRTIKTFNCSSTICPLSVPADSTGTAFGTSGNPFNVSLVGTNNIATVTAVTAITNALPAGTNVLGHVITDAGSTTAVTGTVTISGTVTANAGTNLNTSALALEAGGNLAAIAGAVIAQEATTSGVKGVTAFGAVTNNAPTYTTAKSDALSLTAGGGLRIDLKDTVANTNNLNVNLAASAATVTVSATNLSTNVAQINGVTPLMGNGTTGTGSMRVTIASDNTANSNPWLVAGAAASGASKAGNPVQVGAVFNTTQPTVTTGQAVEAQATARGARIVATGTDTFNVTVSAALPAGTALLGKTGIDQTTPGTTNAVALAQIGSTTTSANNGTASAGTQRVAIASDNSAVAGLGAGATGSAVPANAVYQGNNVGGNTTGQIGCGSSAVYDASTNGATQLVALASSQKVYVCGYTIFSAGTVNVDLRYGTGTNCATGGTKITPAYQLTAQTGVADGAGIYRGMSGLASNALCINTNAAVAVQAVVYYTQF